MNAYRRQMAGRPAEPVMNVAEGHAIVTKVQEMLDFGTPPHDNIMGNHELKEESTLSTIPETLLNHEAVNEIFNEIKDERTVILSVSQSSFRVAPFCLQKGGLNLLTIPH